MNLQELTSESKPNVLIIDDDTTLSFIIQKNFEKIDKGIACTTCNSADKALDYLKNAIKGQHALPDLMLVDINMPLKNGFEFMQDYEAFYLEHNTACIIYFLSSSIREADKTQALSFSSVTGFHSKSNITTIAQQIYSQHFSVVEVA